MGACVDRDVSFENDTVKQLRTQMIIEYLKHNESDVKNIRSTSGGIQKHSIRSTKPKKADISQESSKNISFSAYADKRGKEFNLVLEALTPKACPVDLPSNRSQESQFQFSNRCISVGKALIGLQKIGGELKQNDEEKDKIVEEIEGDPQISGYIEDRVVQEQLISDSKPKNELKKLNTEIFPITGENLTEQDYKKKFNTEIGSSSEDEENCNPSPGKSVFGSKNPMFDFRSPELLIKLPEATENIDLINATSKNSERSSKSFNQSYSEHEKFSGRILLTENKESISSRELELQAFGVNLPSMNLINLKFDESYPQIRSSPLDLNTTELLLHNESSPRKTFLLQLPSHNSQLFFDSEPKQSENLIKVSEISDFSNRPVSPRIDSKKPNSISIQTQELVNSFELTIPEVPETIMFQAQYLPPAEEAKHQLFAENTILEEENQINEIQEILLEDFEISDKSVLKINKDKSRKTLRSGRQIEKNTRYNFESEDNDSPNFMATPEIESLNLLLSPEINNCYRDPLIFAGGYRKGNLDTDLHYLESCRSDLAYNRSLSPDYSSYNRMESPNPNKSFESPYRSSWIPSITIMRESGGNPFPVADSFNIPDIRASINSSMFKNSKVHLLRKSPQRLRPELYKRNLEGKLTAHDELTLQG